MKYLSCWLASGLLAASAEALTAFTGTYPKLPSARAPFGYGSNTTGGAENKSAVYVVENMMELREALTLDYKRTVYVKGEIDGLEISAGNIANCQWFIDNSRVKQFNFTQYFMSLNATYMTTVADAVAAGKTVDGHNATEYQKLLKKMNVRFTLYHGLPITDFGM